MHIAQLLYLIYQPNQLTYHSRPSSPALTHDLHDEVSPGCVALRVPGDARVGVVVGVPLHRLHDQRAVGEGLLAPVDGQHAAV